MDKEIILYEMFKTGYITLTEYLKTQELPSVTINKIRKAIRNETNRK